MHFPSRLFACITLGALVITGCAKQQAASSSEDAPSAAAASPLASPQSQTAQAAVPDNVCSVLPDPEASKLLGVPAKGTRRGTSCLYEFPSGNPDNIEFDISVMGGDAGRVEFQGLQPQGKSVSGLGYPAFFSEGTLHALKGSLDVAVQLYRKSDTSKMDPQLPAVAKLVLGRI